MKHAEFILKIKVAKAVHDCYERLKDWELVAAELGVSPMLAGSRNAFYKCHARDAIKPELGHLNHKEVAKLNRWLNLSQEELKALLVRNIGTKERICRYWPDGVEEIPTQKQIRLLLKSVSDWKKDEDWFVGSDDKYHVHWKHNPKQEQAA